MHDFAFIFAGFFVGLVIGLTGVGGGSLMTPILIFFFGVKPYLAVGTDLLFTAFTKMGGTVKLARARVIDWRVVFHLVGGQHSGRPAANGGSHLVQGAARQSRTDHGGTGPGSAGSNGAPLEPAAAVAPFFPCCWRMPA